MNYDVETEEHCKEEARRGFPTAKLQASVNESLAMLEEIKEKLNSIQQGPVADWGEVGTAGHINEQLRTILQKDEE